MQAVGMLNWFSPNEEIAMSLGELRQACRLLKQGELGARLGMSQAAIAQFEKRADVRVANLIAYVEALGGELEITAKFPSGHRVRLRQFVAAPKAKRSAKEHGSEEHGSEEHGSEEHGSEEHGFADDEAWRRHVRDVLREAAELASKEA